MLRIQTQNHERMTSAKMVLRWICFARRPLKVAELLHALAVEIDPSLPDERQIPPVDMVVSQCAGLVIVDPESEVIRLVHYTTQEFFDRTKDNWFLAAESIITETCTTYMSFDALGSGPNKISEFQAWIDRFPFYRYAAPNWGHHAKSSQTIHPTTLSVLRSRTKTEAMRKVLQSSSPKHFIGSGPQSILVSGTTGLHMAAYFGLKEIALNLLDDFSPEQEDIHGMTPIAVAAEYGHLQVVQALLELSQVEKFHLRNNKVGSLPLVIAAGQGHEEIVKFLLGKGANADSKHLNGPSALFMAAQNGHKPVVEALLDAGADCQCRTKDGTSSLLVASITRSWGIAELLINRGADVTISDNDGRIPLLEAATSGNMEMVKLLLQKGARFYATPATRALLYSGADCEGANLDLTTELLTVASRQADVVMLELFLRHGAKVNAQDMNGHTVLHRLAMHTGWGLGSWYSRDQIMKIELLLRHGSQTNIKDGTGHTPLFYACQKGSATVVNLMLDLGGGNLSTTNNKNETLLFAAVGGEKELITLLLKSSLIDANAVDVEGRTALIHAVQLGYSNAVEILLNSGSVNVNYQNPKGFSALMFCQDFDQDLNLAADTAVAMAKSLLAHGADLNLKDRHGQTLLSDIIDNQLDYSGIERFVNVLVGSGQLDLFEYDKKGETWLFAMIRRNFVSATRLLLDQGSDPNHMSKAGRTALDIAIRFGNQDIIDALLAKQARVGPSRKHSLGSSEWSEVSTELKNLIFSNPSGQIKLKSIVRYKIGLSYRFLNVLLPALEPILRFCLVLWVLHFFAWLLSASCAYLERCAMVSGLQNILRWMIWRLGAFVAGFFLVVVVLGCEAWLAEFLERRMWAPKMTKPVTAMPG